MDSFKGNYSYESRSPRGIRRAFHELADRVRKPDPNSYVFGDEMIAYHRKTLDMIDRALYEEALREFLKLLTFTSAIHRANGRTERAAEYLNEVLALSHENDFALLAFGRMAMEDGNLTLANDYFQRIINANDQPVPGSSPVAPHNLYFALCYRASHLLAGYLQSHDLDTLQLAEDYARRSLEQVNAPSMGHNVLGNILSERYALTQDETHLNDSQRQYMQAAMEPGFAAMSYSHLSQLMMQAANMATAPGQKPKRLEFLKRAAGYAEERCRLEDVAISHMAIAPIYRRISHEEGTESGFQKARAHIERAVQLDNQPNRHSSLALVFVELFRFTRDPAYLDQATDAARAALSINPQLATAHRQLGTISSERFKLQGNKNDLYTAIKHYEDALGCNPHEEESIKALKRLYALRYSFTHQASDLQAAKRIADQHVAMHDTVGTRASGRMLLSYYTGDLEAARDAAQIVLQHNEQSWQAHEYLLLSNLRLNDMPNAIAAMQAAYDIIQDNPHQMAQYMQVAASVSSLRQWAGLVEALPEGLFTEEQLIDIRQQAAHQRSEHRHQQTAALQKSGRSGGRGRH